MCSPKSTTNVKNSGGKEITIESLSIAHIVTDEDGSLKIKRVEEFFDSKTYLEFTQSMGATIGAAAANK
jgi:hypothetical protein